MSSTNSQEQGEAISKRDDQKTVFAFTYFGSAIIPSIFTDRGIVHCEQVQDNHGAMHVLIKVYPKCRPDQIKDCITEYASHIKLTPNDGNEITTFTKKARMENHYIYKTIQANKSKPSYQLWKKPTAAEERASEIAQLREDYRVQEQVQQENPEDFGGMESEESDDEPISKKRKINDEGPAAIRQDVDYKSLYEDLKKEIAALKKEWEKREEKWEKHVAELKEEKSELKDDIKELERQLKKKEKKWERREEVLHEESWKREIERVEEKSELKDDIKSLKEHLVKREAELKEEFNAQLKKVKDEHAEKMSKELGKEIKISQVVLDITPPVNAQDDDFKKIGKTVNEAFVKRMKRGVEYRERQYRDGAKAAYVYYTRDWPLIERIALRYFNRI